MKGFYLSVGWIVDRRGRVWQLHEVRKVRVTS
jgi:hypothetical protein